MGYDICADEPRRLSHANLDLELRMPTRIELSPELQKYAINTLSSDPVNMR